MTQYGEVSILNCSAKGSQNPQESEVTTLSDEAGMQLALRQAEVAGRVDEVPIGAVILQGSKVIGQGYNQVRKLNDPTAHAEIMAIREATDRLQSCWLTGCTIYVTLEPCAMCSGALVLARIERLVFGAWDLKAGACGSLRNVVEDDRLNHILMVQGGVRESECGSLLREFFQAKR